MNARRNSKNTAGLFLLALAITLVGACEMKPSPNARFTIGPDTTLVSGPLNADGTINYVAAVNARLSAGVTRENNAAIPFIEAFYTADNEYEIPIAAALGVVLHSDKSKLLESPPAFLAQKLGHSPSAREWEPYDTLFSRCTTTPWKANDAPLWDEWLTRVAPAMQSLEAACERPRFYLPWVSRMNPHSLNDAIPPSGVFRGAAQAFQLRAMRRAGDGDFEGACLDLRRALTLARFSCESQTYIGFLVAFAIEPTVMKSFAGLIQHANATQLPFIQKTINDLPPLPPLPMPAELEGMFAMETVMECIRGNAAEVMAAYADPFGNATVQLGDLHTADWDVVLRTIRHLSAPSPAFDAKPFEEKLKELSAIQSAMIADGAPGTNPLIGTTPQPTGAAAVDAYLKRRMGESRTAYSARIAKWWVWRDVAERILFLKAEQRGRVERTLALLTISLSRYRLTQNAYPESLAQLQQPLSKDPFSGKDFVYRREGQGYILYSVGMNGKDDGGNSDDLVLSGHL